jgi:hypothetical protein
VFRDDPRNNDIFLSERVLAVKKILLAISILSLSCQGQAAGPPVADDAPAVRQRDSLPASTGAMNPGMRETFLGMVPAKPGKTVSGDFGGKPGADAMCRAAYGESAYAELRPHRLDQYMDEVADYLLAQGGAHHQIFTVWSSYYIKPSDGFLWTRHHNTCQGYATSGSKDLGSLWIIQLNKKAKGGLGKISLTRTGWDRCNGGAKLACFGAPAAHQPEH